jgi:hypothetical protein
MSALPSLPWMPGTATTPPESSDTVIEADAAPTGVADPGTLFESQARLWNHLLDANRNMFSPDAWMPSNLPWPMAAGATGTETAAEGVNPVAPRRSGSAARKGAAKARSSGGRGAAADKPRATRHH